MGEVRKKKPSMDDGSDSDSDDWGDSDSDSDSSSDDGLDLSFVSSLQVLGLQLGVVKVARSRVESVEEVVALGRAAIKNGLPPHRLMLAPDCGLGFLPLQVAEAKLANMVEAAKQLSSSY